MWTEKEHALHRDYQFTDFKEAMAFMQEAAVAIDRENHHPEWSNVYNKVHVKLTTHDSGNTVTDKDRKLAEIIEEIAGKFKQS